MKTSWDGCQDRAQKRRRNPPWQAVSIWKKEITVRLCDGIQGTRCRFECTMAAQGDFHRQVMKLQIDRPVSKNSAHSYNQDTVIMNNHENSDFDRASSTTLSSNVWPLYHFSQLIIFTCRGALVGNSGNHMISSIRIWSLTFYRSHWLSRTARTTHTATTSLGQPWRRSSSENW